MDPVLYQLLKRLGASRSVPVPAASEPMFDQQGRASVVWVRFFRDLLG